MIYFTALSMKYTPLIAVIHRAPADQSFASSLLSAFSKAKAGPKNCRGGQNNQRKTFTSQAPLKSILLGLASRGRLHCWLGVYKGQNSLIFHSVETLLPEPFFVHMLGTLGF